MHCKLGYISIAPWYHLRLPSCGQGSNLNHTIFAFKTKLDYIQIDLRCKWTMEGLFLVLTY